VNRCLQEIGDCKGQHTYVWAMGACHRPTGWPQKSKPLTNKQKIVLKPVNEIRQIKV